MPGEAGGRGSPAACLAAVRGTGRHCFTGVVIVLGKSLASCVFKLFTSATPHSSTLCSRRRKNDSFCSGAGERQLLE